MTDDKPLTGKSDQVIGRTKEIAGKVSNNPDLEDEGRGQHAKGAIKEGAHTIAEKVKDVVHDVKD